MLIEIATTDFETTRLAVVGGADRIELCAGLSEGGITPSAGLLELCRQEFELPIYPIIRPRSGDFLYSEQEFEIMRKDIMLCRSLGYDGVVFGLLNPDGTIDRNRTAQLIELAYPMEVTFHRAFDRCADPFEALEQLIDLGCERILTSGQMPTAPEGMKLIASLQEQAAGRIVIMPGSGVRPDSIVELARQTRCVEFHTSLRSGRESAMTFKHSSFMNSNDSYQNPGIEPGSIAAMKQQLSTLVV